MKNSKWLCGVMLLAGMLISGTALADRGHGWHGGHGGHGAHIGLGFYFGAPYPYYPYYPYPYYYPYDPYYPRVITVPAQPPVYIEQDSSQLAPPAESNNYWYHCDDPEGYYPYIKECPGGWQRVLPTPPPRQ